VDKSLVVDITWTWLFVTSGTAPIEILAREYIPKPISPVMNNSIKSLFLILKRIILFSIFCYLYKLRMLEQR
jgi:hypothetical protein